MKTKIAIALVAAGTLAGCASPPPEKNAGTPARSTVAEPASGAVSHAMTLSGYKRDAALHISGANAGRVYGGRPQALLRSVVVVKYVVDARGRLLRSEIMRSNHDRATEAAALHSLRGSAPLPKPAAHLLRHGQLEIAETWLFNDDGRFQLRTIAQPQMNE